MWIQAISTNHDGKQQRECNVAVVTETLQLYSSVSRLSPKQLLLQIQQVSVLYTLTKVTVRVLSEHQILARFAIVCESLV